MSDVVPKLKACKHISEKPLQNPVNRVDFIRVHNREMEINNTIGTPAYL
jgi:hypothetical protein